MDYWRGTGRDLEASRDDEMASPAVIHGIQKQVDFQLNLNSETVDHAHPADAICVEPTTSVRDVFLMMKEQDRGAVLVCEDEKLIGIFTERDALRLMARDADLNIPIEEVMKRDPTSLSTSETVGKAITKMAFGGYRRLPLVDDVGRPVGILKVPGILHYLVEHFPAVVYTLPPQPDVSTKQREGA